MLRLATGDRRFPKIGDVDRDPTAPARLVSSPHTEPRSRRELVVVVAMTACDAWRVVAVLEPCPPEHADRLERLETGSVRSRTTLQHGHVHEVVHEASHSRRRDPGRADVLECSEVELGREDRGDVEQRTRLGFQQVVGPGDSVLDCPLPLERGRSAERHCEWLRGEGLEDLGWCQGATTRRDQLDRQWQSVAVSTDRRDRRHGRRIVGKIRVNVAGARKEQANGLMVLDCDAGRRHRRYRHGLHGEQPLAVDGQRSTTRGQHDGARTASEQRRDEGRARIDDMLAVVEDHQHVAMPQVIDDAVGDRLVSAALDLERAADRVRHGARLGNRGEVAERQSVGQNVSRVDECGLRRDLECQSGLSDATGADQRDQRGGGDGSS